MNRTVFTYHRTASRRIAISLAIFVMVGMQIALAQNVSLKSRKEFTEAVSDLFKDKDWANGKKLVDEGLKKYPEDSDLNMLLGKYFSGHHQYDTARYVLIKSLEYNPRNYSTRELLVNVEIATGRYSSAVCYINELLEVTPYNKELWLRKIEVYRMEGYDEVANSLLKRLLQIYPDDNDLKAGYLYNIEMEMAAKKQEGKYGEAIDLAETLTDEEPGNEANYLELINDCLKAGDYQRALMSTQKGLYRFPDNTSLICKKADILASLYRYNEALDFLQAKINDPAVTDKQPLRQRYNYILEENAQYQRKSDPYALYWQLFRKNPRNAEAFNYVVNTAINRGLYDDALEAVKLARKSRVNNKNLLLKERMVYEKTGNRAKADEVTEQLFKRYPNDSDIAYGYTLNKFRQAKAYTDEGRCSEALGLYAYVAEHGDGEQAKAALTAMFNCNLQLGGYADALDIADRLARQYPNDWEWPAQKATVLGLQGKYTDALREYEQAIQRAPQAEHDRVLAGYDELAADYVKRLANEYRFAEASQLINHWLEVNPASTQAIDEAIHLTAETGDNTKMEKYAALGLQLRPDDAYYRAKLAEAACNQGKYKESFEMLAPEVSKKPYQHELVDAYSQAGEDYARQLIREAKYDESLAVLDSALAYDPADNDLKYWKGLAYEKLHRYDSAYHYQSFYRPSPSEAAQFNRYMAYLENRTHKNQVSFYYLRSKYGDSYNTRGIATLEYVRTNPKNTYSGTVNYTGREDGKGVQGLLEWTHYWTPGFYTTIDAAGATDYFPEWIANLSAFKVFANDWEMQLGAGYRRTADGHNLINAVGGVTKQWGDWWLNVRGTPLVAESQWYYNIFTQGRYYWPHPKSYITAMGSFGSAPDMEAIDYSLYTNGFSVTNAMVGMGANYLVNSAITLGLLGTWYNYKITDPAELVNHGPYRNLFNLYLQLHVSF